jgi:hypothetical protein
MAFVATLQVFAADPTRYLLSTWKALWTIVSPFDTSCPIPSLRGLRRLQVCEHPGGVGRPRSSIDLGSRWKRTTTRGTTTNSRALMLAYLIDALTSSLEQLDDEISCGLITVAPQSRPSDEAQRAAENKPRLTRKRCSGRVRCSASLGVVPWSHSTRRIVVLRVRPTEVVIEVAATGRSNINVL